MGCVSNTVFVNEGRLLLMQTQWRPHHLWFIFGRKQHGCTHVCFKCIIRHPWRCEFTPLCHAKWTMSTAPCKGSRER